ncbi:D-3-phosphoglycerate dehydrogenase 2 [Neolecta irregularis DAH-3]|uniref:2-oxoglutarate reductase n=1 Tax=Neolecta irregularis (strain DAH-3) TaxID=1198029 RepID=A0A1U7LTG5_NEOID|nr:D-3-phosphoglycerate dehydrogenase 2 [Neolecta irregularis DAH-3]|eukprot:OLL25960.1 D-3-phosphoglycerate dehydrogenase 2 [Neolecta irregularis DAH-3]
MSRPIPIKNSSRRPAESEISSSPPSAVEVNSWPTYPSPSPFLDSNLAIFTRRQSDSSRSTVAKQLKPFATRDIKILLLENINQAAHDIFRKQGYQVESFNTSLPVDQLIEKIHDVHVIGIRSKTNLTSQILQNARNLVVVGCFCIGTNQVNLEFAAKKGIAVFNSPFSNSRSVAELVLAEIVCLARQLCERSMEMHQGTWNKVSAHCSEIRGKTLGIVGYGHIGSQLSVLAESMGMKVIYYDVVPLMALGTAKQMTSLNCLLSLADFVSLHVPELAETTNMIGQPELAAMQQGSYIINASRGHVVQIPALIDAMKSGHIAGAALDVYPNEPVANGPLFTSQLNSWTEDLVHLKNLILSPHIGGSTEEAQSAIGAEVGEAIVRYVNEGATTGAVNFPEVRLRPLTLEEDNHARVLHVHQNVPGVLRTVNEILSEHNVDKQFSDSRGPIAYLMADVSNVSTNEIENLYKKLTATPYNIATRLLY